MTPSLCFSRSSQAHGPKVLYPTSNLADSALEDLLTSRGFQVTRLNAYETRSPNWSPETLRQAKDVDIVTFFSPSAADFWAEKVGRNFLAVTFGPTTAAAALKLNFREVRASENMRVDSLADLVERCAVE
jgi:uroporphyrinogen-III synthase